MNGLYVRGAVIWMHWYDEDGRRRSSSTGFRVGQEARARQRLERMVRLVAANRKMGVSPRRPLTVGRYVKKWIADRQARGIASARVEESRLRIHAVPSLGALLLSELRAEHIRRLVRELVSRMGPKREQMSARSVCHVYAALHNMLGDARREGLIEHNPCDLKRGELPKKRDKDPLWRAGAVFRREEVEQLISDERIPADRRVFYALDFLGGMRTGEVSALRWEAYDATLEPLGGLVVAEAWDSTRRLVKGVKTQNPREVPVHPVLAKILAAWRLSGFRRIVGRTPKTGDLVVPAARGGPRDNGYMLRRFHLDCATLGLRKRRHYDSRATFISLAQEDGALPHVLERITHGPKGTIFSGYTRPSWRSLCDEVAKLRIELRAGRLLSMPKVASIGGAGTAPVQPGGSIKKTKQRRGVMSERIAEAAVLVPAQRAGSEESGGDSAEANPRRRTGRKGVERSPVDSICTTVPGASAGLLHGPVRRGGR